MKTIYATLIAVLISITLIAQNMERRDLESFNKVYVTGDFDIYVVQGSKENAQINVMDIALENVITEVDENTLKIRPKGGAFSDYNVKITLTVRTLLEVDCNNSAQVKIRDKVKADAMRFKATTGGIIQLTGEIDDLDVEAFQGGQVDIKGKSLKLKANIKSGGILSATDLEVDEVDIKVNTGGKAEINVQKKLVASVMAKSSLGYFGTPEIEEVKTSLGGIVSAWDKE